MSKHYLKTLFSPTSIAVFGANNTEDSVGQVVFKNLLEGGYKGKLYPINPQFDKVLEQPCYKNLKSLGQPVDLAIITAPAKAVASIIEDCGEHDVKMAVIISAGFSETGLQGAKLEKKVVDLAKKYGIHFIGPNCLGFMRTEINLNATFFKSKAKSGNLALVSQSGALCAAVLDWAVPNDVGFSTVVSMGTSADLDFGEVLDFLVSDPKTQGILLYVEGIHHARSFMSSLRAAARIKPVLVIKSGRHQATARAAMSHSGALIGEDEAFDAALQRAGVVRVSNFGQLFSAAKTLASRYKAKGNRLAIVTNGGGPGVMATDRAADLQVPLAQLAQTTIDELNKTLPVTWSHANPIDIISDAGQERYHQAVSICLKDPNVDAVLVILTPQAMSHPLEAAQAMVEIAEQSSKPILACWMGGTQIVECRRLFVQSRIPEFRTPEAAVEAFYYLSAYHSNQQLLLQTPSSMGYVEAPDIEGARMIIESVLAERRKILTEMESKALLGAFRIPIVNTATAHTVNEAIVLAASMGFPVALKINSPDITHKSDVGGVKLNLQNASEVREAFREIMQGVKESAADARVYGVTVGKMSDKVHGRELYVGVFRDPVFGPVISLGMGGTMVEVIADKAVSLPPLNRYLARTMINKTRAAKLLEPFRKMPAANIEAVEAVLLHVSEMVCELPWLQEMDINPLIVDENGAVAVDARVVVNYYTPGADRYAHMAIYPYPTHLVEKWELPDGTDVTIRPIRPEDADMEKGFVKNLSEESKYFRFMQNLHELTPIMVVRFTQIDYDRELALIAVAQHENVDVQVGVARYSTNPDGETCEFALVVSDQWQGHGFAHKLMTSLMNAARSKGLKIIQGEVLSNNHNMLKLMHKLGFACHLDEEDRTVTLVSRGL
ncbi:bifunctional acetate--CoA ligase family protein/GNAT family N-acetyltransferase [Beggiatoa leptomitoformis]|uniref:GNAT family N-acetyltransferase n=1 Tax=Beggiatoa leptomitoformis TaxID=288004 RepID=A0A2N9YFI4_9GAMM|nr:bifunctional acetate--CoA ligase family protein/GNAT family N-acetyltransferase [Beggiatoa leptomitoformis]ALG68414.1 GNAT family N-acetyltransferase [Beggiatoa leptomitoformis]AUI69258.1 GNAT family N-acetyltransferase [Beggiatoa leptomitoformis]